MIKPVNLFALSSINDVHIIKDSIKYLSSTAKDNEIEIINHLCNNLRAMNCNVNLLNDMYIGFNIPQISKEFDLLRIGDSIINIELKSQFVNKVERQLKRNLYYLRFLGKPIKLFTYCAKENKLWSLSSGDELVESSFNDLVDELSKQENIFNGEIEKLFNPSDYLISPFNSTHKFLKGEYFLTSHQEEISDQIFDVLEKAEGCVISIEGKAGTGKTLLLYNIANCLRQRSKKIMMYHVGLLNGGHIELNNNGWDIKPIKSLSENELIRQSPDVILVDEAQRLDINQFQSFYKFTKKYNIHCIFCHDENQTLRDYESNNKISNRIKNIAAYKFNLTEKIRTNKDLSEFINLVFGRKDHKITRCNKARLTYFDSIAEAAQYINYKTDNGYDYISHTPAIPKFRMPSKYDRLLHINESGTAHSVIGQEFDNVIAVIDDTFFYDEHGDLLSHGLPNNVYSRNKMFFQAVTRVRNRLEIVVIDNIEVYKRILDNLL